MIQFKKNCKKNSTLRHVIYQHKQEIQYQQVKYEQNQEVEEDPQIEKEFYMLTH